MGGSGCGLTAVEKRKFGWSGAEVLGLSARFGLSNQFPRSASSALCRLGAHQDLHEVM